MLSKLKLQQILFLDIETVPLFEDFNQLAAVEKELFEAKTKYQRRDEFTAEAFYNRAGIWAEFGKIICISVGYFVFVGKKRTFRMTSFAGDDEIQILIDFSELLNTHFNKAAHVLCAHNGKEFDFPFIARRLLINGLPLPKKLNLFGKKPWEIPHLDTLELWKFGDYKHYTSLKLLTHILGIPSPKDDIDGSEVAKVYYQEKDLPRIVNYCQKDTLAVAQILLRLRTEDLLQDDEVILIP
jgi:uncharacterized protein YprB with RNaseH-like and TPR domain